MKILKKIGLIAIILVVCLASSFQYVNAEQTDTRFVYNSDNTYYFMVTDVNEFENFAPVIVAQGVETDMSIHVSYPIDYPTINIFDPDGETFTQVDTTYIGEYNGNKCYSFVPGVYSVANGTHLDLVYSECITFSTTPFAEENDNNFSVYNTIYNLIDTYIYGGSIQVGSHQDLTATILSSIICILVFALPFLIIWKLIRVIMG